MSSAKRFPGMQKGGKLYDTSSGGKTNQQKQIQK